MLRNYLKIAFRNLLNNKAYSFINLFGLTTGLVCFLLIALYLFDEITYDSFYSDSDRIYRVIDHKTTAAGKESKVASVGWQIAAAAPAGIPEIEGACHITGLGRVNIRNDENDNVFHEDYNIADPSFLKILDLPVIQGNRQTALAAPHTAVITDEMAMRLFGRKDVLGKVIRSDREDQPYYITAVVRLPRNTHLRFNLLFSQASPLSSSPSFSNFVNNDWTSNIYDTYLKIKKGQTAAAAEAALNRLVAGRRTGAHTDKSYLELQPLKDIRFYSSGIEGSAQGGNIMHIYVFALVGMFVLLIACINYMNLTTARFSTRSKEIAVRKVAGAGQANLVGQFMAEALLLTITAQVLSLLIVTLLLPAFNAFTEKQLTLDTTTDFRIWTGIWIITIVTGLLAGSYPAFFQARLKPYLLLKNKIEMGKGHLSLRRVLVVLQFSLSIIMIIATLVVYLQLRYIRHKDLGFDKAQLVVVDINSGKVRKSANTIQSAYAGLAAVKNVCITSRVPGEWKNLPRVKVQAPGSSAAAGDNMFYIAADDRFLNTYSITLQKGRNFSRNNAGDSNAVLINEAAARILGITEPAEQTVVIPSVNYGGAVDPLNNPLKARVIGIVNNFNFQSLREQVGPMIIGNTKSPIQAIDYFTARIAPAHISTTLRQMEDILHQADPAHIFEYNFLDKKWELFYREDHKRQVIFLCIAGMTILIACLGLFGLVTFSAKQRTKEIGIRKVLGASIANIVLLISKDFLQLVFIATLLAVPVAGWAMHNWLQDFAYRIPMHIWIFIVPGLLAVCIALFTISFQAIKAALANPVKSLRTE